MKNNRIQDIITKSLLQEASSEELSILESWRKESLQNENLYQEYSKIWNISAAYKPVDFTSKAENAYQQHIALLAKASTEEPTLQVPTVQSQVARQKTAKVFTIRRVASIAALFAFVVGAMLVFNVINTTTITAEDGIAYASLEDGSSIWLDEGSSLTYKYGFGEFHREVKLEGKAFFDVTKNKDLGFAITGDGLNVSVLGTSFTVDTKNNTKSVSVKTGKVSVEANQQSVILLPNEKATLQDNKLVEGEADEDDILWRNSDLSFNNARLDQVVADINMYHNDKITLKGSSIDLDCPFTSKSLSNTPFENIIEILKVTYDLQSEMIDEEGSVVLTINSCK